MLNLCLSQLYPIFYQHKKTFEENLKNDDLYVHESGIIEIFVINFEQIGFPLFQMAKNMQQGTEKKMNEQNID